MYPHERSLVEELKDQPFVLLGVNSDRDLEKTRQRVIEERLNWRSFWNGPMGPGGPIASAWGVTGWPTLFVIDAKGVIRYRGHSADEADPILRQCLEELAR